MPTRVRFFADSGPPELGHIRRTTAIEAARAADGGTVLAFLLLADGLRRRFVAL